MKDWQRLWCHHARESILVASFMHDTFELPDTRLSRGITREGGDVGVAPRAGRDVREGKASLGSFCRSEIRVRHGRA